MTAPRKHVLANNAKLKYSEIWKHSYTLYCLPYSAVPTLTIDLTPNVTYLPNVPPYNTFFLICTATSSVEGVENVAIPKIFIWKRTAAGVKNLRKLSSNGTIQIVDGPNLNQSISTSMLTVTENIPHDYRYRCRVDLNLSADRISTKSDVYPITVSGMQP